MRDVFCNVNASESGFNSIRFRLHDELTHECCVVFMSDLYAYDDSIFLLWREGMPDSWRGDPMLAVPNGVSGAEMEYNGRFWVEPYSEGKET